LEGGHQLNLEGLADPLVNAQMALRLWPSDEQSLWPLRFRDLLGELYYRKQQLDSAELYFHSVLQGLATRPEDEPARFLKANNLQGLGNVALMNREYTKADSLYLLANDYYLSTNSKRAQGVLLQARATIFEKQKLLDSAATLLNHSLDLGTEIGDDYVITSALQGLGNVHMRQYRATKEQAYYDKSLAAFRRSQTFEESNPYYTNGRLARLMQSRASRDPDRVDLVDSALVFYKISLEQARERGALNYFKYQTQQLTNLCDWLLRAQDRDCAVVLGASTAEYLYQNYVGVVDTITRDLTLANTNKLTAELARQDASNRERIRNNWGVSAGAIVVLGLIFLLLWQKQKQRRLEARMEALRAQINPHFFSNSLNAIESLVNLDQRKAASKYLIHFSRLTRRVLNSSMEPNTTLKGELTTTEHFLALEQLRFKDKLYYDIEVDPDIEPERVEVPSLILQPYLENAIWHGIKPKTVPSLLQIKARKRGKQLYITIEDDGIGREAAAQQQQESVLKRKSYGMKITKERLRRFGGGKVEIEDLYDEDGKARGTRIHLELPLKTYTHKN
jgi:two-component sensor histidine kinase